MKRLFRCFFAYLLITNTAVAEEITFGVSISTSAQREAFYTLANNFEKANPGTTIQFKALTSEDYKRAFPDFLKAQSDYDVLYWHSGERLFEYVKQGLVLPISDVWEEKQLIDVFDSSVVDTLKKDNEFYAIPISYYQIGFYYSKPLFKQLGLTKPTTWQEFMTVCRAIKDVGTAPIFIGTASNWPATAWFDYLNIRINGLAFHQQLTQGKIPFTDDRVSEVLQTWLEPIQEDCFIDEHHTMTWREGLPFLYRDLVGMSMIGNYVIQDLPESVLSKLGFFAFPRFENAHGNAEEAPIDVLLIPKNTRNHQLAKRFLAYVSQSEVQSELNTMLGVISPHRDAQTDTQQLVKEAYKVLSNASGLSQFFDRDAIKAFADEVMPLLDKFMLNQNIEKTQTQLEEVRVAIFGQTNVKTIIAKPIE